MHRKARIVKGNEKKINHHEKIRPPLNPVKLVRFYLLENIFSEESTFKQKKG